MVSVLGFASRNLVAFVVVAAASLPLLQLAAQIMTP